MKLFLHDFLISLALTLLIGGMILLIALGLSAKPSPLEAKKSERLSVEELERQGGHDERSRQRHKGFRVRF